MSEFIKLFGPSYTPKSKSAKAVTLEDTQKTTPFTKDLPKLNPGARRRGQIKFS